MRDTYPAGAEAEPRPPLAPVLRRRPELPLREEDEEEEDDEEEEEVPAAIRGGRGRASIDARRSARPSGESLHPRASGGRERRVRAERARWAQAADRVVGRVGRVG